MEHHPIDSVTAQEMHKWVKDTIDGLFVSNDLYIVGGVYIGFGDQPYDHHGVCIEI